MTRQLVGMAAAFTVCWTSLAAAQSEAGPSDLATAIVPPLDFKPTPRDTRGYDEYFLFHKPGVSADAALGDIKECNAYSIALAPMAKLRPFVPLGAEDVDMHPNWEALDNAYVMWGLVGVGVIAVIQENLASDNARGNTRRCMGYKGYRRYGTSRTVMQLLRKGGGHQEILRLAIIASGQPPPGEGLEP